MTYDRLPTILIIFNIIIFIFVMIEILSDYDPAFYPIGNYIIIALYICGLLGFLTILDDESYIFNLLSLILFQLFSIWAITSSYICLFMMWFAFVWTGVFLLIAKMGFVGDT